MVHFSAVRIPHTSVARVARRLQSAGAFERAVSVCSFIIKLIFFFFVIFLFFTSTIPFRTNFVKLTTLRRARHRLAVLESQRFWSAATAPVCPQIRIHNAC